MDARRVDIKVVQKHECLNDLAEVAVYDTVSAPWKWPASRDIQL